MMEFLLIYRLDLIQIDHGVVLEAFFDPDLNFTGCSVSRGGNGRHEDGMKKADRLLSREHQHRAALVG